MMIDTMIVAYAAFNVQSFRPDVDAVLAQVTDVIVPESFLAEIVNVAWLYVR